MNICEKCGKNSAKPLRSIPVKKGKTTVIMNVCKECFEKAI
jgi:protein-arginine kinase activator protein McsA